MGYSIREEVGTCQLGQAVTVDALARVVPQAALAAALAATNTHEARALRLSPFEEQLLFRLGGHALTSAMLREEATECDALQPVLEALNPNPGYLVGPRWNILGANAAARVVFSELEEEPNLLWLIFTHPAARRKLVDWERHARRLVAMFRVHLSQLPDDPWLLELLERLKATSPEFSAWWSLQEIIEPEELVKEIHHPTLGRLRLQQTVLLVESRAGVVLVLYTPLDVRTATELRAAVPQPAAPRADARPGR